MKSYLDSSFLFSLYAPDDHSATAAAVLARSRGPLVLSSLTELEVVNALELRVFRKELTRAQVDKAQAVFEEDIRGGVLAVVDLQPGTFLWARKLILQSSSSLGCRTADVLHIAAALEIGAGKLLTFDHRQKELARRVKLPTN